MRAKSKWAIGLLVFQLLSVFSWLSGVDYDAATLLLLSLLYQQIPTIGALILIFYNHKYATIYKDKFNLLQKWIFVLVWIQPIYSFLSYALAGSLSTVIARWIGSCLFPAISCLLLYFDWKDAPTQAQQEPQQMQIPLPEETKETPTKQQRPEHEQKEEKHFTDTLAYPLLWIAIIALMAYLFFLLLSN